MELIVALNWEKAADVHRAGPVCASSPLQYISTNRNGNTFQVASSVILPPPPYSLYAIETPP
ncbi:hypothetical protein KFY57_28085, partial [Salmonella enterica subsp. enterica serovar Typhimurium]|nr:hypothetical protein [Salmonella enterica subsp. enterica serovar Typhimurium]